MKKIIAGFVVTAMLVIACRKEKANPSMPPGQPSMVGKWKVDSVITYFYDTAGLRGSNVAYPGIPDIFTYNFQFNTDNSWNESFFISPQDTIYVLAKGTYITTSDSTFTLLNPDATPGTMSEACKELSLTSHLFIFSKDRPTIFNGNDPGFIRYVFRLTR